MCDADRLGKLPLFLRFITPVVPFLVKGKRAYIWKGIIRFLTKTWLQRVLKCTKMCPSEPLDAVSTPTPPPANVKIKMVPRGKVVGFRCGTKNTKVPPKVRYGKQPKDFWVNVGLDLPMDWWGQQTESRPSLLYGGQWCYPLCCLNRKAVYRIPPLAQVQFPYSLWWEFHYLVVSVQNERIFMAWLMSYI